MLDILENLPLPFTMLVVVVISIVATIGLYWVMSGRLMWWLAIAVPIAISYVLYWSPLWFAHRTDVSEYSAWAPVLITAWSVPSVLASLAAVGFLRRWLRSREHV